MKNIWSSKKNVKWIFFIAFINLIPGFSSEKPRLVPSEVKLCIGLVFLVYGLLSLIFRPKEVE
jgi:hypothetical protein